MLRQIRERCAALDVHKKMLIGCAITPEGRQVRRFATHYADLLRLAEWLQGLGVEEVAMESTGVYWKAPWNVLEARGFKLTLVNARDAKAVPGRKTDIKDAEWLAELHQHGLLKASFVPDREQRELRELIRHRKQLVEQRSATAQRLQHVLEGGNVKLGTVATNVLGVSSRAILDQLVAGADNAEQLAELAIGRLRNKREDLAQSLTGSVEPHQRFMLATLLRQIDFVNREIAILDEEVKARTAGRFRAAIELIDQIPGIGALAAEQILAELGINMEHFPSAQACASWAKICPGTHQSADTNKRVGTGKGNIWLRNALIEAAKAAVRKRDSYYSALYRRIKARSGSGKANVAVAHSILVTIYHMLKNGSAYQDLGPAHFDREDRERVQRSFVRRLERLGFKVSVEDTIALSQDAGGAVA
ncbi:MAG TPA: IS110 family transposase [Ktedonobacterales bacterium]|nr:IS110 family transposase [Ktedonobacterales bacterium]